MVLISRGPRVVRCAHKILIYCRTDTELSDEKVIDERAALKAEELIAAILKKTSEEERVVLRIVLKEMIQEERAYKSRPEVLEFLADFMDNLGLPEDDTD